MILINQNDVDIKFGNALISQMLKESDVIKIRQRSAWDENKKEWSVPHFFVNDKKADAAFPTINGKQRVDQVRNERDIAFDRNDESPDARSQGRQMGNF